MINTKNTIDRHNSHDALHISLEEMVGRGESFNAALTKARFQGYSGPPAIKGIPSSAAIIQAIVGKEHGDIARFQSHSEQHPQDNQEEIDVKILYFPRSRNLIRRVVTSIQNIGRYPYQVIGWNPSLEVLGTPSDLSQEAIKNIGRTFREYNKQYGFRA